MSKQFHSQFCLLVVSQWSQDGDGDNADLKIIKSDFRSLVDDIRVVTSIFYFFFTLHMTKHEQE